MRQFGEVGDGLLAGSVAFALGLLQEDGGLTDLVGDGSDVEDHSASACGNRNLGCGNPYAPKMQSTQRI